MRVTFRAQFTEAELIEIATRAVRLIDYVDALNNDVIRERLLPFVESVSGDVDELCAALRAVRARCGDVQGECPRYSDPETPETPCEVDGDGAPRCE
jgi:hypothetical protein